MSTAPPPNPSGYQPADGEGFTAITIDVAVSQDYQKVAVSGQYEFPNAVSYSEVLPAFEDAYEGLKELAEHKLADLISGQRTARASAPAAAPAPAAQAQVAADVTELPWQVASKPEGRGTFKYLPSSFVSELDLVTQAKDIVDGLGIPKDEVVVFDNRTGNYAIEQGNTAYSVGIVKPRKDSRLSKVVDPKRNVAYVDFDYETGAVTVNLSKDGQVAATALALAVQ